MSTQSLRHYYSNTNFLFPTQLSAKRVRAPKSDPAAVRVGMGSWFFFFRRAGRILYFHVGNESPRLELNPSSLQIKDRQGEQWKYDIDTEIHLKP